MSCDTPNLYKEEIPVGQYGVLHAEVRTGIITFADGERISNTPPQYLLFTSLNDAEDYANRRVQSHPKFEYIIVDNHLKPIKIMKNHEYISQLMAQAELSKKKRWWKFW